MRITRASYANVPLGTSLPPNERRLATYSAKMDPLRGVMRGVSEPISAAMGKRIAFGYPEARSYTSSLETAAKMLSTVGIPGPSTIRVTPGYSDLQRITGALVTTLSPGRGGLLDLGDAFAGAQQTFISRQVTLTDFIVPESETPGAIVMTFRHQLDINTEAIQCTPAGRDPRCVETAWYDLSEVAAVAVNRLETGGVRASLMSLEFLVACRYQEYADRCAAESLRAYVVSSCDCMRISDRLDRMGDCLASLVRSRIFPHRILFPLGGLLSWVSQREIASITTVIRGPQEGIKTDMTDMPRSTVNVPACSYVDMDEEIKTSLVGERCVSVVYLVFVYGQRLNRESVKIHVIRSRLPETAFKQALDHLYSRIRTSNVITGNEGLCRPTAPVPEAAFPLTTLYYEKKRAKAAATGASIRNIPEHSRCLKTCEDGKYDWRPDFRGRPTRESCMYAAYCRIGYMDESSVAQRKSERCNCIDVPKVFLTGLCWNVGTWHECY